MNTSRFYKNLDSADEKTIWKRNAGLLSAVNFAGKAAVGAASDSYSSAARWAWPPISSPSRTLGPSRGARIPTSRPSRTDVLRISSTIRFHESEAPYERFKRDSHARFNQLGNAPRACGADGAY